MSNTTTTIADDESSSIPVPTTTTPSTTEPATDSVTTTSPNTVIAPSSTLESTSYAIPTRSTGTQSSSIRYIPTRSTTSASRSTTASSPTSAPAPVNRNASTNVGAIVGGVGGFLLLALIGFLIYKFFGCCGKGGGKKKRIDKESAGKDGIGSYEYDMDYNAFAASGSPTRQHSMNRANNQSTIDNESQYTPRPFVPAYDPIAAKEGTAYNTRYKEILTGNQAMYPGENHLYAPNQYEVPIQNHVYSNARNVPNESDYSNRHVPNEL
ncbi:hypothetical protein A0J61_09945 [Choanephora cucurbitarum]|uniref:Mid2 domain-containing protein n=1 Tax=Choanephora cucurbitarum TaxID=101091 RepID=A0A1C7N010_9FUNG|nr:hypothetical protein A0J61_09945 [Choanephora cucurbitarum]